MGAQLVFRFRNVLTTSSGTRVALYMDLFKISPPHDPCYPEGFKFSWIAFDPENPEIRILFDCHSPKGPHLHIDSDPVGTSFKWTSLENARSLFYLKVIDHFGEHPILRGGVL